MGLFEVAIQSSTTNRDEDQRKFLALDVVVAANSGYDHELHRWTRCFATALAIVTLQEAGYEIFILVQPQEPKL